MASVIALVAMATAGTIYARRRREDTERGPYEYAVPEKQQDARITSVHLDPTSHEVITVGRLLSDTVDTDYAYATYRGAAERKRANRNQRGYDSFPWAPRELTPAWRRVHPDRRDHWDWNAIEQWENSKVATQREIADEESPNFTGTTAARTMKRFPNYISTVDPNRVRRRAGRPPTVSSETPY